MKNFMFVLLYVVALLVHGACGDASADSTPPQDPEQEAALCVVYCHAESEFAPPVCGSDGVTYGSNCLLRAVQCRDPTVTKAHNGKCEPKVPGEPTTPPPEVQDDPYHTTPEPTMPDPCLRNCTATPKQEVCASNNVTFLNSCHFQNARCDDAQLRVVHHGACVARMPKRHTFCDGDMARECSSTQRRHAPICGSDKVTYKTACDFKIAFCRSHATLGVAHEGPCRPKM